MQVVVDNFKANCHTLILAGNPHNDEQRPEDEFIQPINSEININCWLKKGRYRQNEHWKQTLHFFMM